MEPAELFFNPGAEFNGLLQKAYEKGLPAAACSIVDPGERGDDY